MSPESMETYRSIQASLLALEREVGELRGDVQSLTTAISQVVRERDLAREEHRFCRNGLEKRMDEFEGGCGERIGVIEKQQQTLLTWGKALTIIGGLFAVVLVVLNIAQAFGVNL